MDKPKLPFSAEIPAIAVALELRVCADSHDPDARLLGNVPAKDIKRVCDEFAAAIVERDALRSALRGVAEMQWNDGSCCWCYRVPDEGFGHAEWCQAARKALGMDS